MIETKTRIRDGRQMVARDGRDVGNSWEHGMGLAALARIGESADAGERRRAQAYLDLWERHVAGSAIRGRGVAAPWFSR